MCPADTESASSWVCIVRPPSRAPVACHPRSESLAWPCAADGESSSSRLLRMGSGTEELRTARSSSSKAAHADAPRSKSEQLHDRHRRVQALLALAARSQCEQARRLQARQAVMMDCQTANIEWLARCAAKCFATAVASAWALLCASPDRQRVPLLSSDVTCTWTWPAAHKNAMICRALDAPVHAGQSALGQGVWQGEEGRRRRQVHLGGRRRRAAGRRRSRGARAAACCAASRWPTKAWPLLYGPLACHREHACLPASKAAFLTCADMPTRSTALPWGQPESC